MNFYVMRPVNEVFKIIVLYENKYLRCLIFKKGNFILHSFTQICWNCLDYETQSHHLHLPFWFQRQWNDKTVKWWRFKCEVQSRAWRSSLSPHSSEIWFKPFEMQSAVFKTNLSDPAYLHTMDPGNKRHCALDFLCHFL